MDQTLKIMEIPNSKYQYSLTQSTDFLLFEIWNLDIRITPKADAPFGAFICPALARWDFIYTADFVGDITT